jgi:hypothetical protein
MFHTYVVNVYSKCYICFRRILQSSVLCCKCLMLFGESRGAVSDGRTDMAGCTCGATNRARCAGDRRGGLLESPVASYERRSRPMPAPRNGYPDANKSHN